MAAWDAWQGRAERMADGQSCHNFATIGAQGRLVNGAAWPHTGGYRPSTKGYHMATISQADINTLSEQEAKNALAIAMERIARMQQSSQRKLTLKVSDKGAVSLYGLGRFPVTLYGGQWERLLDEADRIREFLKDNANLLSTKD